VGPAAVEPSTAATRSGATTDDAIRSVSVPPRPLLE